MSSPGSPRLPEAEGDSRPFGAPHQSIVPMRSPLPTWRRGRFYCERLLKVPLARDDGVIDALAPGAAKIAPPRLPFEANDSVGELAPNEWLFPADSNSSNRFVRP